MNEKLVRNRLKKMTIIVIIISIIIMIGGSIIAASLNHMLDNTMSRQMEDETEEYKINMLQKIEADLQTLYTLSSFFEFSNTMNSDSFARGLYESNNHNSFIRMGYFNTDGTGIRVMANQSIEKDIHIENLNQNLQEIIKKAWQGESAVSKIYYDDMLQQKVFAYGVPVYKNEKIIGALLASTSTDVFEEILDDSTALSGHGRIRLIGSEGYFLISTNQKDVQKEMQSIYDGDYISEKEKQRIAEALEQGESIFSRLYFEGVRYRVYIEPIGVQGWNLFCVESEKNANATLYKMITVTRITFSGVIVLAVFLIWYGYRLLRKNNKQLINIAYHDALTGAYNTVRFMQELEYRLKTHGDYSIIAMNIRQFKFINEIFGRVTADKLLCHIKSVLEKNLQPDECFGRDSADTFLMMLKESDEAKVRERLEKIICEITDFTLKAHQNYQMMLYCGAAFITKNTFENDSATMVMTHTMFALQKARELPLNSIWFYDLELHKYEKLENYVESHMHQALTDGEFKLFLQPKIDLNSGVLGGAEALVRWIKPDGSMIYPNEFIPIFEKNGFCAQLDIYMFELVCRQIKAWKEAGRKPVPISVNQSKILFYEEGYVEKLTELVSSYDVPANLITLEILEGLALENVDRLNEEIGQLKAVGFRISMDDFGSGYSSLNTLGRLNIDELKLDKAFLEEVSQRDNSRQKIIMAQMIKLTKNLHISTVAEGVETEENERFIKGLGCDYGQGYYYSRPISAEEFNEKYMK